MRKFLIPALILSTAFAVAPASAQHGNRHHGQAEWNRGGPSRQAINELRRDLQRASRNGITGREFASLRVQVNRLQQRLRVERRDRDGRRY